MRKKCLQDARILLAEVYFHENSLYENCFLWVTARGVMVIVVGIGHDDTSSNPGRD